MADDDAFELHGADRASSMLITCEHASPALPAPLVLAEADRPWFETHWAFDIGAATVARRLADRRQCTAILSKFSRLVCDPNRDATNPTWIRTEIEGHPLSFNQDIDAAERERRRLSYHDPYHAVIDRLLGQRIPSGADIPLLSIHSFTPVYAGEDRSMELGILFDRYAPIAERLAGELRREGFVTALNAPYSGMDGVIFAAQRHGTAHNVVYLEIEVRQDLIADEAEAEVVADRIGEALDRLKLRARPR